jgi:hypothetical protein
MTRQQFLDRFYLTFDKFNSLSSPGYEPQEIEVIASEAQESLVISAYNSKSNRLNEGFEETEKRIQDLGNLVKPGNLTPLAVSVDNLPNGRFFELPNTLLVDSTDYSDVFWFLVFEQVKTDDKKCGEIKNVIEINHQEYNKLINDPFNKPNKNKVWRMRVNENRIELVTDGTYNITNYVIRYIKKPQPIVLTSNLNEQVSELNDHIHREILRKTLLFALKDTGNYDRLEGELKTNNSFIE